MLRLKSVHFETQEFQNHVLAPDAMPDRPGRFEWSIGRNPTCDVILASPEVSRLHARIAYADRAYYFFDADSTSGSLLNGEMTLADMPYPLTVGDLIQVGERFIYVEELTHPAPIDADAVVIPTNHDHANPLIWAQQDITCRCDRIINETSDVKTFCLVATDPIRFSDYQPGQFATLAVVIDGKTVFRPYSLSSSPTRPHHLSVTIKRVPHGLVSNWMHDDFQVGDQLQLIGGPMGLFSCLPQHPEHPECPAKMLLISAGSGITPMMSMSRWVQDTISESDVVFLHSARQPQDIIFRSELEIMAAQMSNFRLAITLTRSAGTPWMGLTGRISVPMLNLVVPDLMLRSVFVCGPTAFTQHVRETLESLNFPMDQYQEECFGDVALPLSSASKSSQPVLDTIDFDLNRLEVTKPVNVETPIGAMMVTFNASGATTPTDGSLSVLALAEQSGVSLRSACRMGACGMCKIKADRGDVRYENHPSALSPTEQAEGYLLACVAYPIGELALDA
jgi:glycine betaine catabolism B